MPEPQPLNPVEQVVIRGLNMRIAVVHQAFGLLNEAAKEERYHTPDDWALSGAFQALALKLIHLGLVTDGELTVAVAQAQCQLLEQALEAAAEHLKETTGTDPHLGWVARPQG